MVRVALAVIALHIAVDAMLRDRAGTPAAAQVTALVPAAVATALAIGFPRWRPGVRGTVALVCGVLALVAGVAIGLGPALVDGLRLRDLPGVLSASAGVVLVAVGVATVWRSRRHGRRWPRRLLVAALAAAAAIYVVVPVGLAIVVTHRARTAVTSPAIGPGQRTVAVTTADGVRLQGLYVPSRNGAAVLAFPGQRSPAPHARLLARHGYGVLLLDRRGEGGSPGDFNARGWDGEADVRAGVAFLRRQPDVDPERVGGLGLSVGGELLLQAAAHDRGLSAVVSEGAGVRSLREQLRRPDVPLALRWLSPMLVETAVEVVLTGQAPPEDLVRLAKRIGPTPVLLIRARDGHEDEVLNPVYRRAIGPSAQLWQVAGGHTGALAAQPGAYERRVLGFFDRALVSAGTTSTGTSPLPTSGPATLPARR